METPQDKTDKTDTKLVSDPKRTKMIKIRAKRDIRLKDDTMVAAGKEVLVTEEEAAEFTKSHEGMYAFSGERENQDAPRHVIQRAERVA
jgi:hypothetical protein